jgi:thiamine transport system substrate-binding protein
MCRMTIRQCLSAVLALALLLSACTATPAPAPAAGGTLVLLTHSSWAASPEVIAAFEQETGITVEQRPLGDAGEALGKVLIDQQTRAAGAPALGDVLYGVDNTLLGRALAGNIYAPYKPAGADAIPAEFVLDAQWRVAPVDYGDVCLNYDKAYFAARALAVPGSLEDLTRPEYKDLLVVENAATSSPGLAFLLATIARYGEDGYQGYWAQLRANGVKVVNGWTEAYEDTFSGGGGKGTRPIVVSYASSPPAEIVYAADPKPTKPSTSVMTDGCFRQVEYAGVLKGTKNPLAARAVVDWLLSPAVQADVPLSMFVLPAVPGTPLPKVFTDFAATPADPLTLDPALIDKNRSAWIDAWDQVTLR